MIKKLALCFFLTSSTLMAMPGVEVCFTPNVKCQSQIINEINNAKRSIKVQAYSFTDVSIADALVSARKRGVDIIVILDKSHKSDSSYSVKDTLKANDIPYRFDCDVSIAHNKVMIIDESIVITGSYNFSRNAYKNNTENLLIIRDTELAEDYLDNWLFRWDMSEPLEGVN